MRWKLLVNLDLFLSLANIITQTSELDDDDDDDYGHDHNRKAVVVSPSWSCLYLYRFTREQWSRRSSSPAVGSVLDSTGEEKKSPREKFDGCAILSCASLAVYSNNHLLQLGSLRLLLPRLRPQKDQTRHADRANDEPRSGQAHDQHRWLPVPLTAGTPHPP